MSFIIIITLAIITIISVKAFFSIIGWIIKNSIIFLSIIIGMLIIDTIGDHNIITQILTTIIETLGDIIGKISSTSDDIQPRV